MSGGMYAYMMYRLLDLDTYLFRSPSGARALKTVTSITSLKHTAVIKRISLCMQAHFTSG